MADLNTPMSSADHVVCMCALVLVLQRFPESQETKMLCQILEIEGAKASALNPKVQAVAEAADDLRRAARQPWKRGSTDWAAAEWRARGALRDWAEWRLGVALDQVRAGKAVA